MWDQINQGGKSFNNRLVTNFEYLRGIGSRLNSLAVHKRMQMISQWPLMHALAQDEPDFLFLTLAKPDLAVFFPKDFSELEEAPS